MAVTDDEITSKPQLPRWDVTDIFPSLESPAFAAAHEGMVAELTRLRGLYDEHGVRGGDPHEPSDAEVAGFEQVVDATNALLDQVRTLRAYISSYVTTDATNDTAQAMSSELQAELTELARLT